MSSNETRGRAARMARTVALGAALAGAVALAPAADAQAQGQGQRQGHAGHQGEMQRGPMDGEQHVARQVAMLTQRLQLTSAQQAEVRRILTTQQTQMQALRSGMQGGQEGMQGMRGMRGDRPDSARAQGQRQAPPSDSARAAMREQMQARMTAMRTAMEQIHTRTEQEIEGVLTAQQRTTYRELRESTRNERGPRPPHDGMGNGERGPRGGGARPPRGGR